MTATVPPQRRIDSIALAHALRTGPMSRMQIVAIGLCICLNLIDGFDILAMAYITPVVRAEWGLSAERAGVLLSAGLVGMTIGAIVLSILADHRGRRPVGLICLTLNTLGMIGAALSHDLTQLLLCRLVTGIGVGGMMPAVNTVVAEYASDRTRNMAIVLQAAGYPLGGLLGGLLALPLMEHGSWRAMFAMGALASCVLLPIVLFHLPESVQFLRLRTMPDASSRLSVIASRLGIADEVVVDRSEAEGGDRHDIGGLGGALRGTVLMFTLAVVLVQFSFYFFMSWMPALLVGIGLSARFGLSGALLLNAGGIAADLVFAVASRSIAPAILGGGAMIAGFAGVVFLFATPQGGWMNATSCFFVGAFLFGAMASLYALAPILFPPSVRSTATGLGFGIGRIGGALGPYLGGLLLGGGAGTNAIGPIILAAPLLGGAALLWSLTRGLGETR